jgi:hypothetical protein
MLYVIGGLCRRDGVSWCGAAKAGVEVGAGTGWHWHWDVDLDSNGIRPNMRRGPLLSGRLRLSLAGHCMRRIDRKRRNEWPAWCESKPNASGRNLHGYVTAGWSPKAMLEHGIA